MNSSVKCRMASPVWSDLTTGVLDVARGFGPVLFLLWIMGVFKR